MNRSFSFVVAGGGEEKERAAVSQCEALKAGSQKFWEHGMALRLGFASISTLLVNCLIGLRLARKWQVSKLDSRRGRVTRVSTLVITLKKTLVHRKLYRNWLTLHFTLGLYDVLSILGLLNNIIVYAYIKTDYPRILKANTIVNAMVAQVQLPMGQIAHGFLKI